MLLAWFRTCSSGGLPVEGARVDVFRAVAKALRHRHAKALRRQRRHLAIGAIASAAVRLQAQQADARAHPQAGAQGVVRSQRRGDIQSVGLGAVDKTRRAAQRAGPGLAVGVHRARQQPGQLGKKCAVRIRHGRAHHPRAHFRQPLALAVQRLQGLLAGMKRRHRHSPSAYARKPAAVAGMATKPGKASMRASQARMCG